MHDCLLEGVVPKPQVWHEQLPPGQGPGPCWAGWRVAWPQSYRSWPELAQLSLPAPKRLFFLTESWVKSQWSWPGCTPQAPPGISTQARPASCRGPGRGAPLLLGVPGTPHQEGLLVLNPVPASTVGRGSESLPGEAGAVSLQREAFLRWSACRHRAPPCASDRWTEGCPLGPPRYLNHPHANGAAQTLPPSPDGQMSSSTAPLCSLRRYHLSLSGRGRALTLASTGHG